jgi:hypothetical protein
MTISYDLGVSEDSVAMPIVVLPLLASLPYPGKEIVVFRFILEYIVA